MKKIPFNQPFIIGNEIQNIKQSVKSGKISGDGVFTKKCQNFFEDKYGFKKVLLTSSCTDALEMCAILCDINPGDEVIIPSFTFVSTANAFAIRGAKIIFADCKSKFPNIDEEKIEGLITKKTKVIVVVHYAGFACNMDKIIDVANKHGIFVIEDAAHSIDSYYKGTPLGSIGDLGTFSFHETKNIICGEGGMLAINNKRFIKRAEIIREKGTNRSAFFRGEVNKYGWIDIGSSYLPSEISAAFLYGQIEYLDTIQSKRITLWNKYYSLLQPLAEKGKIILPAIPDNATNNGHIFYILCKNKNERNKLLSYLNKNNINAIFHYLPLHKSLYYKKISKNQNITLPNTEKISDTIIRLPLYYKLNFSQLKFISDKIYVFFE